MPALWEARIKQVNSQQSLTNLGLPVTFTIEPDLDEKELIRKIQFLGLPESIVKTLDPDSTPASLIPVTAPFDGIVTNCAIRLRAKWSSRAIRSSRCHDGRTAGSS